MKIQKGFTLVEGLLLVFVIGLISFGGYYVYSQQNKKSDSTSNSVSETDENNAADIKIVTVSELGVAISDPENRGLRYSKESRQSPIDGTTYDEHFLTDTKASEIGGGCDEYPVSLYVVDNFNDTQSRPSVEVNGKWVVVGYGDYYQAPCAPNGVENTQFVEYQQDLRNYIGSNLYAL